MQIFTKLMRTKITGKTTRKELPPGKSELEAITSTLR